MSRCCLLDYFFVKRCFIFSIMQANTQIAHNVNRMGRIPNTINKTTYPKSITVTNNDNVIRRILRFRIAIALKKCCNGHNPQDTPNNNTRTHHDFILRFLYNTNSIYSRLCEYILRYWFIPISLFIIH